MRVKKVSVIAAGVELTAGLALIASPALFVRLLLGASLSGGGTAVGRVGGFGLLSLGIACWPGAEVPAAQSTTALFTYNLLATLYIAYLGLVGGFVGYLLWPAFALHGLLALLLSRPAYEGVRRK